MSVAKSRRSFLEIWSAFERLFEWKYTGIGFVWAWIYCSFETSALFPDRQGVGINTDLSWLTSAAAVSVVLIATGIWARNRDIAELKHVGMNAACLMSLGTIFAGFAPVFDDLGIVVSCVSGVMSGIGSAWLVLWWADALSRLDIEQLEAVVPMASFITLLCTLVFPYIQGVLGVFAVATLPLLSGVMLLSSYRDAQRRSAVKHPHTTIHPTRDTILLLVRLSLVLLVSYFVFGCLSALSDSEDLIQVLSGFDVVTFIGSGFGLVLAVCFIFFSMKIDFTSLFRWLAPLMMLSLALFPWQEVAPNFISSSIAGIADTAMQVILFIYIISMAKRGLISTVLGIGIAQGFVQLGVLAGNLVGMTAAPLVENGSLNVFVLVLALMCALSFSLTLLPQRGRVVGAQKKAPSNDNADIDAVCKRLAVECRLSAREEEVLGYLARGRSQPYIREELLLSKNTVATHVKHIYQKLNVHSRQELLDLVQEA